MNTVYYQKECLTRPIASSIVFGMIFTAIDAFQMGGGAINRIPIRTPLMYAGGLYVYNALQCPMEAIHGRQSAFHNVLAGAIIGYAGVRSGRIGVPFLDLYFFARNPRISPAVAGAAVYGGMGGAFALIGNKGF